VFAVAFDQRFEWVASSLFNEFSAYTHLKVALIAVEEISRSFFTHLFHTKELTSRDYD
jgi:hypothetical protein